MAANITNFNQQALDQQLMIQNMRNAQAMMRGGNCGCHQPPGPPTWQQGHGNMPYARVGDPNWLGMGGQQGYGVDLNNNGRYDRGRDGVLAMDLNRDGKIDKSEIEGSRRRLMSMGGNYDFNGDGQVGLIERLQGGSYSREMSQYDQNRDGQLQPHEFSNAGGRVLIDSNRDGKSQPWEQHSPYSFPTPGFGSGSLGNINPHWGHTNVNHQGGGWGAPPWGPPPSPWGGGGHPYGY